jgi:O-antigen ligase
VADAVFASELSTSWHARAQSVRVLVLGISAVAASGLACVLVLRMEIASVAVVLGIAGALAVAWQPRIGLYVLLALVTLFESVSADPLMRIGYYLPLQLDKLVNSSSSGTGVLVNPFEVLLLFILIVYLAQGIARREFNFQRGRFWWPMMLFLVSLIGGLVHGAMSGDLRIGLWESRFLFYMVVCYVLAANTIRTTRHLAVLTGLILICNAAFSVEGAVRHVVFAKTLPDLTGDGQFEHVDVIFLGLLLVLVLIQNVFGAPRWQRIFGLLVAAPITTYTLLASERRAGYIAVIIALLVCTLVFFFAHRKAFVIIGGGLLIVGSVYMGLFWNSNGLLGQPARAVKSISAPDERDAASNFYRDLERINVQAAIASNPLLGLGFGEQFPFVVPMPSLDWWAFWHYEPHHNILWVWLKTGAIGFIIFFTLVGSVITRGVHLTIKLRDPTTRTFALMTVACVVMTLVFCYVDLGLVSGRVTVLLGTLMGVTSILEHLEPGRPKGSTTT